MRDGIYKNLPLGRGWKSFLKSCERAKDRGETACSKAYRAVAHELAVELSPGFIPRLVAAAKNGESLLPCFRGIEQDVTSRQLGGNNSWFENAVLRCAKRLQAEGVRGRAIVDKALGEAIDDLKSRRVRHIAQHCWKVAGPETKPIIRAARDALARADCSSIVTEVLEGKKPKIPRVNRTVDADEDLTKES